MIVVCNSSPIIALEAIQKLDILKKLFGNIYIPKQVYEETVIQNKNLKQKAYIEKTINDFIFIEDAKTTYSFKRKLDEGEIGVLNLALEKNADLIVMDDKKAINEANEIGLGDKVVFTSTILKQAEELKIINSYNEIVRELRKSRIFLP